jgi:uncharacterized phage protein (TIGR02218 family)
VKSAGQPLIALLNGGADFQSADIWTITLPGGSIVRWSGADRAIAANGHIYALGPLIERGAISEKIGLEVATLTMTITANADDRINGVPIIPFIARRGLDGAAIRLERAFMADWGVPAAGSVLRFAGKITAIGDIAGSSATVTISSWTILLNVSMPTNLYQAACLHSVYDAGCGLDPGAFAVSGIVSGAPGASGFGSTLSIAADDFAQGRIVFTTGANAGVAATVKSNDGAGNFMLIRPLPTVPAAGDGFIAYPGCDLTRGRCLTRFNNLGRHKATPFVPVPETAFG